LIEKNPDMKKISILISAGIVLTAAVISFDVNRPLRPGMPQLNKIASKADFGGGAQSIREAIEYKYSLRNNQVTGDLDPQWMADAVAQADRMPRLRLNKNLIWENMGPDNVGGRTRAFLIHKDSQNIWFVGSVSGGLFRSSSRGSSWTPVNDMQENLSVNCIGQTLNGDIFYGTGEGSFTNLSGTRNGSPAFVGGGIFKNQDAGGRVFKRLSNTNNSNFFQVNSMVSHPTENKLYVGTSTGIWVTTDGGTTFNRIRTGSCRELKIASDGTLFANLGNKLVRSTDGGTTYTDMAIGSGSSRVAIAISPQDPNYVYCMSAASNGALDGVFRSTNKGETWTKIASQSAYFNIFGTNQGWYDNVISVNPRNKDHIIMGGVELAQWDPVNGARFMASLFGAGWNDAYVHADKHVIEWIPNSNPPEIIVGTDGGLFHSRDLINWTERNHGFTSYQLYNVAANYLGWVTGGSQDNGTQLINFTGNTNANGETSKGAVSIGGGDGFDVEFSRYNPKIVFSSIYFGTVYRSANGGQSRSTFWDTRIGGPTGSAIAQTNFFTIFTLWEHPSIADSSRLFLAKDGEVWMCVNPTNFSQAPTWFLIASGLGNDRIIDLEHTPDGNSLFITKDGRMFRVDGLNNAKFTVAANPGVRDIPAGITSSNVFGNLPGGRSVTSINVDPNNSNRAVVTLGNYGNSNFVYLSTNALAATPSYTNITGNLPAIPVYDAFIDFKNPNYIVLGTDLGVFASETGGTTWEEQNSGMARVPVFEIRGYEWNSWMGSEIYLGTHGRGFYRSRSLLTGSSSPAQLIRTAAMTVFPNPAQHMTQLSFETLRAGKGTLIVYNLNGQVVYRKDLQLNAGSQKLSLDVSQFQAGHYLTVLECSGEQKTGKLLVTK
jgi:photosystem II stability/assembly factor-like uncharacterized protein